MAAASRLHAYGIRVGTHHGVLGVLAWVASLITAYVLSVGALPILFFAVFVIAFLAGALIGGGQWVVVLRQAYAPSLQGLWLIACAVGTACMLPACLPVGLAILAEFSPMLKNPPLPDLLLYWTFGGALYGLLTGVVLAFPTVFARRPLIRD